VSKSPMGSSVEPRLQLLPGVRRTVTLFNPGAVHTTRYHYRGAAIPNPWTIPTPTNPSSSLAESRMR
jgi:hypothetical protein